jgi:hypothetical protein
MLSPLPSLIDGDGVAYYFKAMFGLIFFWFRNSQLEDRIHILQHLVLREWVSADTHIYCFQKDQT